MFRGTLALALLMIVSSASANDYDPLAVRSEIDLPRPVDLEVHDAARDRKIPIRVYLPLHSASVTPVPVVVFSHGLGGTREGSAFLGKHWAARGYIATFVQHPGSDDSVWRDQPLGKRMDAMREAASTKNFLLRVQDVPAVLDQLDSWNKESGHTLAGRLDTRTVGMSGHSFGAQTTQALSGQSFPVVKQRLTDSRIKAAVVMSPGAPVGGAADRAFGSVSIPWLLMTGTQDTAPIGGQTVESRRAVFPALRKGDKYELVLHQAEHSVFTERALPGDQHARNPNHHRVILALSTAFWDTYLRHDPAARQWLIGDGPRKLLEESDIWQSR